MFTYVIQPPSHWLYHLANIFLLFSYLSPNLLVLRILLAAGCLCFALWGLLVLDISIDTTVYNGFFFLINTAHALYLAYQLKPVRLDSELEAVWKAMFDGKDGLVMSRRDWKRLTAKDVYVRGMEATERFAARQSHLTPAVRWRRPEKNAWLKSVMTAWVCVYCVQLVRSARSCHFCYQVEWACISQRSTFTSLSAYNRSVH